VEHAEALVQVSQLERQAEHVPAERKYPLGHAVHVLGLVALHVAQLVPHFTQVFVSVFKA
jgi:hypothetical protein